MTEQEIKAFLQKPEVIKYLKENIRLDLSVDPCENIYGYDIKAKVYLGKHLLAKDSDSI